MHLEQRSATETETVIVTCLLDLRGDDPMSYDPAPNLHAAVTAQVEPEPEPEVAGSDAELVVVVDRERCPTVASHLGALDLILTWLEVAYSVLYLMIDVRSESERREEITAQSTTAQRSGYILAQPHIRLFDPQYTIPWSGFQTLASWPRLISYSTLRQGSNVSGYYQGLSPAPFSFSIFFVPLKIPIQLVYVMADTDTDTDEESKPSSSLQNEIYLTSHLATHISATRQHLTGAPSPPEPPYAPSFHGPTAHWTSSEKALFFRALTVHSRLRPDLIAASIATKSTLDVAVYLSLLRDAATRANAGTIARDLHPAAHEVSPALVELEEKLAARVCTEQPSREKEAESEAREEAARVVKNSMRVRRGEGLAKSFERDREGQSARKEAFERWREERDVEWAREDVLGRLDGVALQVLDRMLRLDEENKEEADDAGSGDDVEEEANVVEGESSIKHHPAASSSSRRVTTPRPLSTLALPTPDGDIEDDYTGAIPCNLSTAERRLIRKRLYMRRKRAEVTGGIVQLDPTRLKPGRKADKMSKYRQPGHGRDSDRDGDDDDDVEKNSKQRVRGHTRPYRVQRDLERLGIGADYLCANGMDMFHLGALGRLMRCVSFLSLFSLALVGISMARQ
jgi:hypothetical protein